MRKISFTFDYVLELNDLLAKLIQCIFNSDNRSVINIIDILQDCKCADQGQRSVVQCLYMEDFMRLFI